MALFCISLDFILFTSDIMCHAAKYNQYGHMPDKCEFCKHASVATYSYLYISWIELSDIVGTPLRRGIFYSQFELPEILSSISCLTFLVLSLVAVEGIYKLYKMFGRLCIAIMWVFMYMVCRKFSSRDWGQSLRKICSTKLNLEAILAIITV